jgi:RNA polymerase sigma factor (sigma-70 family)
MEAAAVKYAGGAGVHGYSPLLRVQSDERLIALVRKGNQSAFAVLISRYEVRLLAFCRHLLGSREDAEDVLQEVFAAAYNALLGDDRPVNARPWLYRIARNRSFNHMRRQQAVAVDTMDLQFSDHGASVADKVDAREEFRELVGDIQSLPETQRTALVLREMDALPYEQIAEAMDTTVSSVKSLLVRARVSLAEASEARVLSCSEVRLALGEVAEGLAKRTNPMIRRHIKGCDRCGEFEHHLKRNNRALAALMPIGPWAAIKGFALLHLGHSAGSGATAASAGSAGASAAGASAGGSAAAIGTTATAATSGGSLMGAGIGALATKAAATVAVAAIVTAGAVATHTHSAPAPATSRPLAITPVHAIASTKTDASLIEHRHPGMSRLARKTHLHRTAPVTTPLTATTPAATVTTPVATTPSTTTPTTTTTSSTTTTPTGSDTTTTESSTTPTGTTTVNSVVTTTLPGS